MNKILASILLLLLGVTIYAHADGIFNSQTAGGGGGPGITTIVNNTTPTSGFTSGNIIGSSGNKTVDTGIAYAGLGTITASSTPTAGFASGAVLATSGGVVTDSGFLASNLGKIIAGVTVTSGISSGNFISSSGGLAVDSGVPVLGVGTVSSVSAGCGSTTGTGAITTAGTIVTLDHGVLITGTNQPILATYCGQTVYFQNASPQVPTIAVAGSTGFLADWYVDVCNIAAGTQTITPASGTIGNAATYVLAAGTQAAPTCARLISGAVSSTDYAIALAGGGGGGATGANPTATIGTAAVNGSASTFLRSDGAPAIPQCSSSTFGACKVDNSTITASGGVLSAAGGITTPAPNYISNNWYLPIGPQFVNVGVAVVANTIYCFPGRVGANVTIKSLGAFVGTGVGSTNTQFAIYSLSAGTMTLVDSTGNIASATSSTAINGAVANTTDALTASTFYMFCSNSSGAPIFAGAGSTSANAGQFIGTATQANLVSTTTALTGVSFSSTFNTWPGTITLSTRTDITGTSQKVPFVQFLVN